MQRIAVVDYDPAWPQIFQALHDRLWPAVKAHAVAIEHVGSTSVPGLAAKPIIDLDIVIPTRAVLPLIIESLAALNYRNQGDLGIADREAFAHAPDQPRHNLYVCIEGTPALANHLTLRNHLRSNPKDREAYATLKRDLAQKFPNDIDSYVAGKTAFILSLLAKPRVFGH